MINLIPESLQDKVYYEEDNIILLHGDALEIIPLLPDNLFDMIMADPPYEITSLKWDKWPAGWTNLLFKSLKNNGSMWCFGSLKMFMNFASDFDKWTMAQEVVWEKHNGSNFHNDRFRRVHELIAHFYPKGKKWEDVYHKNQYTADALAKTVRRQTRPPHMRPVDNYKYVSENGGPRLMRSIIKCKSCHGYAVHPTQKPVNLMKPLIEYSCIPEGIILDPFIGSGTTAETAKILNRKCIGIDKDRHNLHEAKMRLQQEVLF